MYHIVLISENRILLKQVYYMLENDMLFRIHIVPFSMDAYEVFYKVHADIVILDTSVFLPYKDILSQFRQSQWSYHILLLCDDASTVPQTNFITVLSKNRLNKELFDDVLQKIVYHKNTSKRENILLHVDWMGSHDITIHPDAYHLFYVSIKDSKILLTPETIQTILDHTESLCTLTTIFYTEHEILFLLSRADTKSKFNFSLLAKQLYTLLGPSASLLCKTNINWKDLHDSLESLKRYQSYTYFLCGSLFNLTDQSITPSDLPLTEIQQQCTRLLSSLLSNDLYSATHILQELYLHILKPKHSFPLRDYVRIQLQFFLHILYQTKLTFPYTSIEEELWSLTHTNLFHHCNYHCNQNGEILKTTILTIYSLYHTNISLDGIATKVNLNKIYLNRIFKEQYHQTIFETLQQLRLLHAKYYLSHTSEKISIIAQQIGFHDIGYFTKFFRSMTGSTALEYRMKYRKKKGDVLK